MQFVEGRRGKRSVETKVLRRDFLREAEVVMCLGEERKFGCGPPDEGCSEGGPLATKTWDWAKSEWVMGNE
jgi:hypothetical protein